MNYGTVPRVDNYALDDMAVAALWALEMTKPRTEQIGLLYDGKDGLRRTPTAGGGRTRQSGGSFKIPSGSLRGIFHNHPPRELGRGAHGANDQERATFSTDDTLQSRTLGVPSYISAGDLVFRYDPATGKTEEVLGQIPVEEIRKKYLAQGLLKK